MSHVVNRYTVPGISQTLFAAQFIGSPAMNQLQGQVDGGTLKLENQAAMPCDGGYAGRVVAGIRPEYLRPDDDGPLQLLAGLAEPLGANTLLHGTLQGSGAALTVSLSGIHQLPRSAQPLKLSVAAVNIHLFDEITGQRINRIPGILEIMRSRALADFAH